MWEPRFFQGWNIRKRLQKLRQEENVANGPPYLNSLVIVQITIVTKYVGRLLKSALSDVSVSGYRADYIEIHSTNVLFLCVYKMVD